MRTISARTISIDKLHRLALDNGISFVSYRLPGESEPVTMVQWLNNPAHLKNIESLQNQSGFVFAPFDLNSEIPIRLIQPDLILKGDTFFEPEKSGTLRDSNGESVSFSDFPFRKNYITSKEEFVNQVEKAKNIIKGQTIEKVVLSRISSEEKPESFDSSAFFQALEQEYPDAFVFAMYIPDAGLWFGASPEPLLLANNGKISTVSLAGTRATDSNFQNQPWGEKEIDEQLIVTQYIDKILKQYGISNIEKTGPFSCEAGMVEHLKTIFSFPFAQLKVDLTKFLNDLHPTPSVCGLPKDLSMKVIQETERHNREYYSGFLGPVNMNGDWNIYVNLRSMKALHHKLEYYLGAGITKGSKAEDEWEETNNKMNTLKSIVESLKER